MSIPVKGLKLVPSAGRDAGRTAQYSGMYIPRYYRNENHAELVAFMRRYDFATVVSLVGGAPFATHIPLVIADDADGLRLRGHVARPNPQWETIEAGETLVIFGGPHAYVSPSAYDTKLSVPTWNYVAVHAYGHAALVKEPDRMTAMLAELIAIHEPAYQSQWDALPEKYRLGMLGGIVGFEITVSRLEGKYKLSQNRSDAERDRVTAALAGAADPRINDVAKLMQHPVSETRPG
ncbi:MAG: FMN-binding negative transcriptional regulator [Gemmatimonadota bacterium]|nr:FMN-binding negative transcriptional regulator [Gemmatimonadota bacterium]